MRKIEQQVEYNHCLAWIDLYVGQLWFLLSTPIDYVHTMEKKGTRIAHIRDVCWALKELRDACTEWENNQ